LFAATIPGSPNKTYKVTGAQFAALMSPTMPKMPWDDHDGGIWHIKNVTGADLSLTPLTFRGTFKAWDIDGTNQRQITKVAVGEELVFVTGTDCQKLFQNNNTQTWEFGRFTNTSKVTDMSYAFKSTYVFNADVSILDSSNVTNMGNIFQYSREFNQDISGWDTSNVTNMANIFSGAYAFNANIGGWDTSSVENMHSMFTSARAFNQDIGSWDTSNVIGNGMETMFRYADDFNQDLSGWCVSNIPSMPGNFDTYSSFEGQTDRQPCWGHCPRGENGTVDPCP